MGVIAFNAMPILDARKKGLKPVEMILVSLIGRINEPNYTVYANPTKQYEWLWARDLEVCIYASIGIQWHHVARAVASVRPSYLAIWDADRKQGANVYLLPHPDDIEEPQTAWRWELDFLPWLPNQNQEFAWS
jgi:hypothetical protein